jgi:hypothetical protein
VFSATFRDAFPRKLLNIEKSAEGKGLRSLGSVKDLAERHPACTGGCREESYRPRRPEKPYLSLCVIH